MRTNQDQLDRNSECAAPATDQCVSCISYVSEDGTDHEVPLAEAWAVPFEHSLPVGRFRSRKGQWHLSGLWWSATTGGHVRLERDHVMLLDFDPTIVAVLS